MQAQTPEVSSKKANTPRYDTIVIKGAKGQNVPKEVDGGEVVAWSVGHGLAAMDALEEFVDDLAAGNCHQPAYLNQGAADAMNLMRRRRVLGWDADEPTGQPPADWKTAVAWAVATAHHVFEDCEEEARNAIEYLAALMLASEPEQPIARWIPVTETLPECSHECTTDHLMVSDSVLVTDCTSLQNLGMGHLKDDGQWKVYEGEHDFMNPDSITHWMPMPKMAKAKVKGGAQ